MPWYVVDFELAGTVLVQADNEESAVDKASEIPGVQLLDLVENQRFGENYVEKTEK
jgi:hypothetical protein